MATGPGAVTAVRGSLLTFTGDPIVHGRAAVRYEADAIVVMADGRIRDCGPAHAVGARLPDDVPVTAYANALITAGFVDAHVHYPQVEMIGAGGLPLLDWLERHTFPAEARYADVAHARDAADRYLTEALRNGTTTAAVFGTVHPHSVDVLFEAALARGMRIIGGKVLMDRHAPSALLDTATRGYDESKALIDRWAGQGRLGYAITPRFAATSTPAQLDAAATLWRERPGTWVQSHVAENLAELAWIRKLFPAHRCYVDVYAHHGLLGPRAIFGHGVHLDDGEWQSLHATGTALAHCPTSNSFLGSGAFNLRRARDGARPVAVALGTDVGGGTSLSMLRTMHAACETAQGTGAPLAPSAAWWLATAGGAAALGLGDAIGTVAPGHEADLAIVDLHSTPLIAHRMARAQDFEEALGIQLALADDRAIRATYVAGRLAHDRDA